MRMLRLSSIVVPLISIIIIIAIYINSVKVFQPEKVYPTRVHKTLFLDRYFTPDEVAFITIAALEWSAATKNIVTFDVVALPQEKVVITENDIMIMNISPDHPLVLILDNSSNYSTLGYYDESFPVPIIYLVSDRMTGKEYVTVVLHELGHALGLEHNENIWEVGSLMYPSLDLGSRHITPYDLKKFCKLYRCNANKLKN
jgi:hypothetical protein